MQSDQGQTYVEPTKAAKKPPTNNRGDNRDNKDSNYTNMASISSGLSRQLDSRIKTKTEGELGGSSQFINTSGAPVAEGSNSSMFQPQTQQRLQ